MKPWAGLIAGLAGSLLLPACIGGGAVLRERLDGTESCPAPQPGQLEYCAVGRENSITKEDVLALWGQPDGRGSSKGQDYLVYDRDLSWQGLVVFVIVPVPLLLPWGHDKTILYFDGDRLSHTARESTQLHAAACGIQSEADGHLGCSAF